MKARRQPPPAPIVFTRADPAELAKFDPRSKVCSMNCGPHADDPRPKAERMLLCPECHPVEAAAAGQHAQRHPTVEECEAAGRGPDNGPGKPFDSGGLPDTPEERARFEAYMRGHCWGLSNYDEALRSYPNTFERMLYGVWRDRGALPTVWPTKGQ